MNNKTCGECSWFSEGGNRCKLFINQYIFGDRPACNNLKQKPTNGDRIRQGGDYALAHFKSEHRCDVCAYYAPIDTAPACRRPEGKICFDGMLEWLNASADCVAENGESAKQPGLCVADNTESEGEDKQ